MAKQEPPKQMRITDETMEQIRAIAQEIGGTQQDVMTHLLQLHQAEQAKDQLPDRAKDIEQYKTYMDAAMQMFLSALQDSASVADATRTKYSGLIDSLQRQVSELQTRCADADRQVRESKAAEEAAKTRVGELESRLAEQATAVADKVRIITELEQHIAGMQADVAAAKTFDAEKKELDQTIRGLTEQVRRLEADKARADAEHTRELWEAEQAARTQMADMADDYRRKLEQVDADYRQKLDQRQDEYMRLLLQLRDETMTQQHAAAKPEQPEASGEAGQ